eukprot:gene14666-biopygen9654
MQPGAPRAQKQSGRGLPLSRLSQYAVPRWKSTEHSSAVGNHILFVGPLTVNRFTVVAWTVVLSRSLIHNLFGDFQRSTEQNNGTEQINEPPNEKTRVCSASLKHGHKVRAVLGGRRRAAAQRRAGVACRQNGTTDPACARS